MKKFKIRFLCLILLSIIFSSYIVVYAGAKWDSLSSSAKDNCKALYAYCLLQGYNDYAAAGICGNADQESSFNPDATSGSGYRGAFQMSSSQWALYTEWANNNNLEPIDIVNQFKYIDGTRLSTDFSQTTTMSLSDYKKCSDIVTATEGFMVAYERCVGGDYSLQKVQNKSGYGPYKYQHGSLRIDYATTIYTALVGTAPSDGGSSGGGSGGNAGSTTEETMKNLMATGYYTEDQLSAYLKLNEINIDEKYIQAATREALTQDELSGLANWQLNVRMQEEEHGFIRFLRTLSMFIGIILVVWAMLFYTAYWIDKTNNILPIEFVFLLSFGKLRISGDENDSTYSFNSESSAKVKMINHKDCIFICVIVVGAGFLLITGIFYSIVQGFVNKALQFLGRV